MPDYIDQLRFRLLQLGCPLKRLQRMVREVSDHREDLLGAALAEGVSAAAAAERADAALGNPEKLAEDLMVSVRRSTWCGWHRFIAFGLLPLLAFPVLWAVIMYFNLSLEYAVGFGWDRVKLHKANDNPVVFHYMSMALHGADYVAIGLATLLFCLFGGRSAAGRNWMILACSICAGYSLFSHLYFVPHNITLVLNWRLQWIRGAIPLVITGLFILNRQRRVRNALKCAAV